MIRPVPRLALALLALLPLSGCMGFDTPGYQAKGSFPGSGGGSGGGSGYGMALLKAANETRLRQGVRELEWDQGLADLAEAHSTDMAQRETMDHAGFETRYKLSGYRTCVENVAQAMADPATVIGLWMDSPGHRANLLNTEVRWVGAARVGQYVTYLSCR